MGEKLKQDGSLALAYFLPDNNILQFAIAVHQLPTASYENQNDFSGNLLNVENC